MPNTDLTKRSLIINSRQCSYKQQLEDDSLKCWQWCTTFKIQTWQ